MLVAALAILTEFLFRLLLPALILVVLGEWIKRNQDLFRRS
jgi:hypothetical protein